MIDMVLVKEIFLEAGSLSVLGAAVRFVIPPEKMSVQTFLRHLISGVFLGLLVAFYTDEKMTHEQQGFRVSLVLLGGYLGSTLLPIMVKFVKKRGGEMMERGLKR